MKFWSAAAYLRMSKSIEEDPANALDVQLSIIQEYIKNDGNIDLCSVKSDNGYSGLNFDRPAYQEMMEEIKSGKINCIIVKDLSRFSRHHLDSCDVILNKFRKANIRFIAVLDGLDSLYMRDDQRDLYIPIRTLINQAYSMELSQKVCQHLRSKWENGEYTSPQPIYGYKRMPEDWYRLVIDEPAAAVIRSIFQWRLEGWSSDRIAKKLNDTGIPSPAGYKAATGHPRASPFQKKKISQWYARSVIRILQNPVYIGTLEQGRTRSNPLYPELSKRVPKSEWIVKEGVHEAIVSREVFEAVGRLLKTDSRSSPSQAEAYPFSGIVRCGTCGNTLSRRTVGKYRYYACLYAKGTEKTCSGCRLPVDKFDTRAYEMISSRIAEIIEMLRKLASGDHGDKFQNQITLLQKEVRKIDSEIECQRFLIESLQPSLREGLITKAESITFRDSFQTKKDQQEREKAQILKKIRWIREISASKCEWAEQFVLRNGQTEFSRKDIAMLIEYVFLYRDKHMEIRFAHDQEFQYIKQIME